MDEQWIAAKHAIEIVPFEATLIGRLQAGALKARAAHLRSGDKRSKNARIEPSFWQVDPLFDMRCDWDSGDFYNCIDGHLDVVAMGVSIALSGLLDMVPLEERGLLARSLSVAGNRDWLTASEARQLEYQRHQSSLMKPGVALIEQARLGFVAARAVLAQYSRSDADDDDWTWQEREWDIPKWFWQNFTEFRASAQNWELGKVSGSGISPAGHCSITLSGVHFHKRTLQALFAPPTEEAVPVPAESSAASRQGRRPTYDWAEATSTVWGQLYRGELIPKFQADIETALIVTLKKGDDEPGVSTARPYAKAIFDEFQNG